MYVLKSCLLFCCEFLRIYAIAWMTCKVIQADDFTIRSADPEWCRADPERSCAELTLSGPMLSFP